MTQQKVFILYDDNSAKANLMKLNNLLINEHWLVKNVFPMGGGGDAVACVAAVLLERPKPVEEPPTEPST